MFVGHYAAALAAKASEPRGPLWAYVGAAQVMDIAWSGLVLAGVEKLRIDPKLPGSPLDLYSMPYTHSLAGAMVIAGLCVLAARLLLKTRWSTAGWIGAVAFSHWLLDLLVHRPDLSLLWGGPPKVGLGLWNAPGIELALEMGLVALAAVAWVAGRARRGDAVWPAAAFVAWLVVLQIIDEAGGPHDPKAMAVTALAAYLATTALAWVVDRGERGTAFLR